MEWVLGVGASVIVAFCTAYFAARAELAKLREELKFDYSVEKVIRHLLNHPEHRKRSFKVIRHHLRGFETDNDLRMALMRAGAVAFDSDDLGEVWGLLERNERDIT